MDTAPTPQRMMAFHAATGMPVLEAKEFLANQPVDLVDRILSAADSKTGASYLTDPIENDPEVGDIVRRILDETSSGVEREHEGTRPMGLCHLIWKLTKERLARDHGIVWYTPAEMNPCAVFD